MKTASPRRVVACRESAESEYRVLSKLRVRSSLYSCRSSFEVASSELRETGRKASGGNRHQLADLRFSESRTFLKDHPGRPVSPFMGHCAP